MATVGTFTIIKNESRWIRAHLMSWLSHVDQMVFFDGNSNDGTLEIIRDVRNNHPFGHRIDLFEDRDPKDYDKDYQRVFNECISKLDTTFAIFAHPDMILDDPGNIGFLGDAHAYTSSIRSFAGEPDGQLYEIKSGRWNRWKHIYRLRNPDLGLHYFGVYGSVEEDCYFSHITGNKHEFLGDKFEKYPYKVKDSGIKILHFSDVRSRERRIERMVRCLVAQGMPAASAQKAAELHPRVNFSDSYGFKFEKSEYPEILKSSLAGMESK